MKMGVVFSALCVILFASCLSTEQPEWVARQRSHAPLKLDEPALLEEVALLERRLDPAGQTWHRLLQPLLVPRYVTSTAHEDVRQHIVNVLTDLGWTVDGNRTFEMQTPLGRMPFTNVVATHDRTAPRRLVLACHYDSIYGRDKFVAATDSAVPCAMMLYLAALVTQRYLDSAKGRSELTLQLMFLDGEEAFVRWTDQDSIYGARHLAQELQESAYQTPVDGSTSILTDLNRIDVFVLLDLLGAERPTIANYQPGSVGEFRHLASVERRLSKSGLLERLPKIFKYVKSWGFRGPPQVADDHLPFLERGVKILHLIPIPFPTVWHEDTDDASVIHRPTVTNLNRILRVFVIEYLGLVSSSAVPPAADQPRVEL